MLLTDFDINDRIMIIFFGTCLSSIFNTTYIPTHINTYKITLALFLILFSFQVISFDADTKKKSAHVTISHGISRFDDLKYPKDFTHFDYTNPNAPKGGHLRVFIHGFFDSVNPYAISGTTLNGANLFQYMRLGFSEINEPLMVGIGAYAPSGDEPMSAYGLIAKNVEYPENHEWLIFNLRPEARFHDNQQITAEDVIFSFEALTKKGHPKYRMQFEPVKNVEKINKHRVKFNFKNPGTRSQLLRVVDLPILQKKYWENKSIEKSSLTPSMNSGPYKITNVSLKNTITFERVNDYWGSHLAVNKGLYNFDKVTLFFYRDTDTALEGFKSNNHDLHIEVSAKNWKTGYNFPAIKDGTVKKQLLRRKMVYGSSLFYFNTRSPIFSDRRVREAISCLYNFEWANKVIFHDMYIRCDSYFPNTPLKATGLPSQEELKILLPWKNILPASIFTQVYTPPKNNSNGSISHENTKKVLNLLKQANWHLKDNYMVHEKTKKKFVFEILTNTQPCNRYLLPFKYTLKHFGITMYINLIDTSQLYQRVSQHDYDMIEQIQPYAAYPDLEPENYFHSSLANKRNTHNYPGIQNPAIDFICEQIPLTQSKHQLITLIKCLDRILIGEHYGIPKWYSNTIRVAYRDKFSWPSKQPDYIPGFNTWWYKNDCIKKIKPDIMNDHLD